MGNIKLDESDASIIDQILWYVLIDEDSDLAFN